jgi:predicted DCC family thiol-disulfide oxidoreductase YuxK
MDRHKLEPRTLIYDRDCEICCWARDLVSCWDRRRRIRYVAFQDPLFREWFPDDDLEEPPKAMLFIDHKGKVWKGVDAFRQMLRFLPTGRLMMILFYVPGVPWMATRFYEWLAKNRYRFQSNA